MEFSKKVEQKIYSSKVSFLDIMAFSKLLHDKHIEDNSSDLTFDFDLELADGSQSYGVSYDEVKNSSNLTEKKITYLRVNYDYIFSVSLSNNSYISYELNSQTGHYLSVLAINEMKLRVNSRVASILSNMLFRLFVYFLSIFSLIYTSIFNSNIFSLLFCFTLNVFICPLLMSSSSKVEIIMGNNTDSFITRNKDNIFVGLIFTIFGYILGKFL